MNEFEKQYTYQHDRTKKITNKMMVLQRNNDQSKYSQRGKALLLSWILLAA